MSRFLQAIEPEKIQSVIDRMRKARWQQPVINLADEDGCELLLNIEGSKRFKEASNLYLEALQAAHSENRHFDRASARDAIRPVADLIERELTPPAFTADEREVLTELVLFFAAHEKGGFAELTLPPVVGA
jgi:hypothetical protein